MLSSLFELILLSVQSFGSGRMRRCDSWKTFHRVDHVNVESLGPLLAECL